MYDILNVRGAMNCATTNAFFVNEMLSFRNGIICHTSSIFDGSFTFFTVGRGLCAPPMPNVSKQRAGTGTRSYNE